MTRWHPKGRKAGMVVWLVYVLVSLGSALLALTRDDPRLWAGVMYLVAAAAGGLMAWHAVRRGVVADDRGLRVVDRRTRVLAWEDVEEIRPDAGGAWATKLVVVGRDGEVVDLPLESELVESVRRRWADAVAERDRTRE